MAAVLWRLGRGPLGTPPIQSWVDLERWYHDVGPATAAMTTVRLGALCAATWMSVTALAQLVASLPAGAPLRRLADHVSPPALRRLGRSMAGLSMSAGLALPMSAAPLPERPADLPTTVAEDPTPGSEDGLAVMRPLADADLAPTSPEPAPEPAPAPAPDDVYTVVSGDSCWSIAGEVVGDALDREPTDREVAAYWTRLLAANADRFVVPGEPDLIYPGQELLLPPH